MSSQQLQKLTQPLLTKNEENRWNIPFENNDSDLFKAITWYIIQDPAFVGEEAMNQGQAADYIGYSPTNFHLQKKKWAENGISQQAMQIITQEKRAWMQHGIQRIMSSMPAMIEQQIKIATGEEGAKPSESTAAFKVLFSITEEWLDQNPWAGMTEKRYLDTQLQSGDDKFDPHSV